LDWLPGKKKLKVVGSQEVFKFPCCLIFRVIISLNLVKLCGLVVSDSVLLVQNLDRIGLVCQVQLQWDGIFNDNISRGLQTSFELGDVKHIVNSQ
jgi:hypothetical protein